MLSPATGSGEYENAVHVSQPPQVAVAGCVWRDGILNPLRRDDLCAIPLTAVEVQQAKPSHIPEPENKSPTSSAVALGIRGPPHASVTEHVCLAIAVRHVAGGQVDSKRFE